MPDRTDDPDDLSRTSIEDEPLTNRITAWKRVLRLIESQ